MCCSKRNNQARQAFNTRVNIIPERREMHKLAPMAQIATNTEPLPPAYSSHDPHASTSPTAKHVIDEKTPLVNHIVSQPTRSTIPAPQQQQQQQQQYHIQQFEYTPQADYLLTLLPNDRRELKSIVHQLKDELKAMKHARKAERKVSGLGCRERKALKAQDRLREDQLRDLIERRKNWTWEWQGRSCC